jgi:hypothetical protein
MTAGSIDRRGMDKRKVCVFLILVAVGILCICVLGYMLFYATGHSDTTIKDGGHSLVLLNAPSSPGSARGAGAALVRL